ncbi:GntR family transcriptional regulator [Jatrophihabitans fulvus]
MTDRTMPPSSLRRSQLSHDVAAYIRENIMAGNFEADSFLRTQPLADALGTSLTPVREGLMVLHSEGTVRWEPRRGFRVVAVTDQDVRDVFDVQSWIAGELAARAAIAMDHAAVARLRALQAELMAAAERGDVDTVDARNHEIHRAINTATPSPRLVALLRQTVKFVPLRFFGTIEGWAQASACDHEAVFAALDAADAETARRAMADHIVNIGDLLRVHLSARRQTT